MSNGNDRTESDVAAVEPPPTQETTVGEQRYAAQIEELQRKMRIMEGHAVEFRDSHDEMVGLILFCGASAATIAFINMFFEKNVKYLGGWTVFCGAVGLLNVLLAIASERLRIRDYKTHLIRCVKFRNKYEQQLAHYQNAVHRRLSDRKLATISRRVSEIDDEAGEYLLPVTARFRKWAWYGMACAIILGYFILAGANLLLYRIPATEGEPQNAIPAESPDLPEAPPATPAKE